MSDDWLLLCSGFLLGAVYGAWVAQVITDWRTETTHPTKLAVALVTPFLGPIALYRLLRSIVLFRLEK